MSFLCPHEIVEPLAGLPGVRAAFLVRCPGVDVRTDRATALGRLRAAHRAAADRLGFAGMPFVTAEQVHGNTVARVDADGGTVAGADALVTTRRGLCLAIYVADCAAVFLAERRGRGLAIAHSGRRGTELEVATRTVENLAEAAACEPADLCAWISPCIRPPHYEVDFAAEIRRQLAKTGVRDIHDSGRCTACNPQSYYSYRAESGQTGRMAALLALDPQESNR